MKLSFREGAALLVNDSNTQATLQWEHVGKRMVVDFKRLTPGILQAFQQMANGGATSQELVDGVAKTDGFLAVFQLQAYLAKFEKALLLNRTIFYDDHPFATLAPKSPYYQYQEFPRTPEQKYTLSRFAYWHRVGEQMILESALGHARLVLYASQAIVLINALGKPSSYQEWLEQFPTLVPSVLKPLLNFMLNAGLLSEVDEAGYIQEDKDETLYQWEFHDLLFHTQSRLGRTLEAVGGTYRFWNKIQSLPAVKPKMSDVCIPLYRPDIEKLKATDIPFTQVFEQRKSIRKHGEKPITDKQLGEFLYRFARVKEMYDMELTINGHTEKWSMSKRPYPSGGGRYSLELYVIAHKCENIPSACYHYYPLEHALYKVSDQNSLVERLLELGRPNPYDFPDNPQVLITIAARFQRLFWKYKGFAYAVLLKESGILTQSMYLVATAMGLAPCEVGIGDAELFARLVGTDYYAETCIGEFVLGSMPED